MGGNRLLGATLPSSPLNPVHLHAVASGLSCSARQIRLFEVARLYLGVAQMNPRTTSLTPVAMLMGLAAASVDGPALAQAPGVGPSLSLDRFGVLQSSSSNNFNTGETNGFFANLGTNGRACATCHVEADAWTLTPRHARRLPTDDPLFDPVDGSDCPPV